jgi:hypothetical protein
VCLGKLPFKVSDLRKLDVTTVLLYSVLNIIVRRFVRYEVLRILESSKVGGSTPEGKFSDGGKIPPKRKSYGLTEGGDGVKKKEKKKKKKRL